MREILKFLLKGIREGLPRTNPQEESIIWNIVPKKTALLIIDMQNCFVDPKGTLYVTGIEKIITNVNKLASFCRSLSIKVVWVRQEVGNYPNDWIPYFSLFKVKHGDLMATEPNSFGSKLHPSMENVDGDFEVVKNRFSPFAPNSPSSPPLDKLLRSQNIDTLIISGTTTDVCCETTARDAMQLDYKVILVSDATCARSERLHIASLDIVRRAFGMVCTAQELIEELTKQVLAAQVTQQ
jgi:ureidoacrylate peracid hydrolase